MIKTNIKRLALTLIAVALVFAAAIPAFATDMPDWWYPDGAENYENFHGENLPTVIDDAGIFTEDEIISLEMRVQCLLDSCEFGYVLFTDTDNHGLEKDLYAADLLYSYGYGKGDNYSATVFYLSLEEGNRGWRTISIGDNESLFTENVCYTIDEIVDTNMRNGNYYQAFCDQVDFVQDLVNTVNEGGSIEDVPDIIYEEESTIGSVLSDKLPIILVIVAVSIIIAIISVKNMEKQMKITPRTDAKGYMVPGSFKLRRFKDYFLYITVTKVPVPKKEDHGGSSFGGGSSSGGGSFSGGGRDF